MSHVSSGTSRSWKSYFGIRHRIKTSEYILACARIRSCDINPRYRGEYRIHLDIWSDSVSAAYLGPQCGALSILASKLACGSDADRWCLIFHFAVCIFINMEYLSAARYLLGVWELLLPFRDSMVGFIHCRLTSWKCYVASSVFRYETQYFWWKDSKECALQFFFSKCQFKAMVWGKKYRDCRTFGGPRYCRICASGTRVSFPFYEYLRWGDVRFLHCKHSRTSLVSVEELWMVIYRNSRVTAQDSDRPCK